MKYIMLRLLPVFFLALAFGCHDVVFYPVKGSISGFVTDNNGVPLSGVTISATFEGPSQGIGQPAFPQTKTVATDPSGYYELSELWDEVELSIQLQGFAPVAQHIDLRENNHAVRDILLTGSPTIVASSVDKTMLVKANSDTASVRVEVQDLYNSNPQGYLCNILLRDANGGISAVIQANLEGQGIEQLLFEGLLLSGELPVGIYSIQTEVQDPDGHIDRSETGLSIQVQ